jgi:hypothetical protein
MPPTDPFAAAQRSLAAIPFTIRTYPKCSRNPFGMNTSRTQDLKLFRMNTYRETGGGEEVTAHSWPLNDSHLAHTRKAASCLDSCGCGQFAVYPGVGGCSACSALADQARVAGITRPSRLKNEAGGAGVKLAAAAPDMTCWKAAWKRSISAWVPTVMRT